MADLEPIIRRGMELMPQRQEADTTLEEERRKMLIGSILAAAPLAIQAARGKHGRQLKPAAQGGIAAQEALVEQIGREAAARRKQAEAQAQSEQALTRSLISADFQGQIAQERAEDDRKFQQMMQEDRQTFELQKLRVTAGLDAAKNKNNLITDRGLLDTYAKLTGQTREEVGETSPDGITKDMFSQAVQGSNALVAQGKLGVLTSGERRRLDAAYNELAAADIADFVWTSVPESKKAVTEVKQNVAVYRALKALQDEMIDIYEEALEDPKKQTGLMAEVRDRFGMEPNAFEFFGTRAAKQRLLKSMAIVKWKDMQKMGANFTVMEKGLTKEALATPESFLDYILSFKMRGADLVEAAKFSQEMNKEMMRNELLPYGYIPGEKYGEDVAQVYGIPLDRGGFSYDDGRGHVTEQMRAKRTPGRPGFEGPRYDRPKKPLREDTSRQKLLEQRLKAALGGALGK